MEEEGDKCEEVFAGLDIKRLSGSGSFSRQGRCELCCMLSLGLSFILSPAMLESAK